VNKKPQMWSKKILQRKTGQTEEEQEHMFVGVFCCRNWVLASSSSSSRVCFCVPVRGGLAESYLAGKRALAVGCEHFCCPFANVHRLHFVVCP
jgi:hypothetical protein